MNVLTIIKSDFKNIFRDRSLAFIVFVPIIFFALLRFAPPIYEQYLPALIEYRAHLLSVFCILSSVLLGFILAFIILEERDQNLMPVFMVMPYSFGNLLLLRVSVIIVMGFLSSILLIVGTGLVEIPFYQAVFLAFASSLTGPSSTFIIASIARNKIEGVSYFKLFNMILMAPIAGMFIGTWHSLLFGIMPYYWIYAAYIGNPVYISSWTSLIIAIVYNLILLLLTFRLFLQRNFNDHI